MIIAPPFLSCVINKRKAAFRSEILYTRTPYKLSETQRSQLLENFIRNRIFQQKYFTSKLYRIYIRKFGVTSPELKKYLGYVDNYSINISSTIHEQNAFGNLQNIYAVFLPKKALLLDFLMKIVSHKDKDYKTFVYWSNVCYNGKDADQDNIISFVNLYDTMETRIDLHYDSVYGKILYASQYFAGAVGKEHLMLGLKKMTRFVIFAKKETDSKTKTGFQCEECDLKVIDAIKKFYTKKIKPSFPDTMFQYRPLYDIYVKLQFSGHAFMFLNYLVADLFIIVSYTNISRSKAKIDIAWIHDSWRKAVENITGEVLEMSYLKTPNNVDRILYVLGFLVVLPLNKARGNKRTGINTHV